MMNETKLFGMLNAGMSETVVSRHFGCTQKTIERIRRWFRVVGNVWPLLPMIAISSCSTYVTGVWLQQTTWRQYGIHPQTVRNRLRENVQPIRTYRPYFGQSLTRRHRMERRDWCRRHLHFRRADWDLILFFHECRVNLSHVDGRERVYRRRGVRFADACIV